MRKMKVLPLAIKLFTIVKNIAVLLSFATASHFHPSLVFVRKVGAYPNRSVLEATLGAGS